MINLEGSSLAVHKIGLPNPHFQCSRKHTYALALFGFNALLMKNIQSTTQLSSILHDNKRDFQKHLYHLFCIYPVSLPTCIFLLQQPSHQNSLRCKFHYCRSDWRKKVQLENSPVVCLANSRHFITNIACNQWCQKWCLIVLSPLHFCYGRAAMKVNRWSSTLVGCLHNWKEARAHTQPSATGHLQVTSFA